MFWVTSRNGLISTKSGIAKVTGKTLTSTAFLLLSVQIQMGSMFPQPNHKSHYGEKKTVRMRATTRVTTTGSGRRPVEGR